jgi:DNA-directed RNA polymerase subunit K
LHGKRIQQKDLKASINFETHSKMEYTKYEQSRIIGSRALQISQGAPFMIKLSGKDLEKIGYNPLEIAKLEFKEGLIPITVKREKEAKK